MELNLNKLWAEYIKNNHYAHPANFLEDEHDFILIEDDVVGTWRWGNIVQQVWKANDVEFFGVQYRDVSGDGDIDADSMGVDFYRVEPQEVTTVKYVRVV